MLVSGFVNLMGVVSVNCVPKDILKTTRFLGVTSVCADANSCRADACPIRFQDPGFLLSLSLSMPALGSGSSLGHFFPFTILTGLVSFSPPVYLLSPPFLAFFVSLPSLARRAILSLNSWLGWVRMSDAFLNVFLNGLFRSLLLKSIGLSGLSSFSLYSLVAVRKFSIPTMSHLHACAYECYVLRLEKAIRLLFQTSSTSSTAEQMRKSLRAEKHRYPYRNLHETNRVRFSSRSLLS